MCFSLIWTCAPILVSVTGFFTYNIACLFGALANFAVVIYVYSHGFSELGSVMLGAFVGMIWNYTMSILLTWRS